MALVLADHAAVRDLDLLRVLKMLVVHDLVEIDAGDTFAYDEEAKRHQQEREERAAERIFALLPAEQAGELRALWDEFEARQSAEARFALALDRLQPMLLNYFNGGAGLAGAWRHRAAGARAQRLHGRGCPGAVELRPGTGHRSRQARLPRSLRAVPGSQ